MSVDVLSEISENNLVAQANALIRASYKITRNEEMLLKAMMSLITPSDSDIPLFSVKASVLAKTINMDTTTAIREFDRITSRLMTRILRVETANGWKKFQWVSEASLENGVVSLKFHENLKPYLLALGKTGHFTQYRLEEIRHFRSAYTSRIYEMLIEAHNKKQKCIRMTLIAFRSRILGEGSKLYPAFKDLRKNVMDVARNELEKTVPKPKIYFKLHTYRTGRFISDIEFEILVNTKDFQNDEKVIEAEATELPLFELQNSSTLQTLASYGITGAIADLYASQQTEAEISRCVEIFEAKKKRGEIENEGVGYLIRLLQKKAGKLTPEEAARQKKEEERKNAEILKKKEEEIAAKTQKLRLQFFESFGISFIATLSEEEQAQWLDDFRNEYEFSSQVLKSLYSPLIRELLKDRIPQYREKEAAFIQENLDA